MDGGHHIGARLLRSHENPWMVGNTVRTITSALRVGGVLFSGTPGEGFPAIGTGVRDAVSGEQEVIQLGLANDQLGYLIAPAQLRADHRRRGRRSTTTSSSTSRRRSATT